MSNWDKRIDNVQQRFLVLSTFNKEAVLDRETGLVWERSPNSNVWPWPTARLFCAQKAVGGRGGWRLPAFNELASLIDPTAHGAPPAAGWVSLPERASSRVLVIDSIRGTTRLHDDRGVFLYERHYAPINVNDAT